MYTDLIIRSLVCPPKKLRRPKWQEKWRGCGAHRYGMDGLQYGWMYTVLRGTAYLHIHPSTHPMALAPIPHSAHARKAGRLPRRTYRRRYIRNVGPRLAAPASIHPRRLGTGKPTTRPHRQPHFATGHIIVHTSPTTQEAGCAIAMSEKTASEPSAGAVPVAEPAQRPRRSSPRRVVAILLAVLFLSTLLHPASRAHHPACRAYAHFRHQTVEERDGA